MSDLTRIAPYDITQEGDDVETDFKKTDLDIKNIYAILTKMRNWYRGTTPPQSPNVGDVWVDTTTDEDTFKKWSGTAWEETGKFLKSDYSQTLKVADIITKGTVVDMRAFGNLVVVDNWAAAINAAIDMVAATVYQVGGGVVLVPAGRFRTKEPIKLKHQVKLFGAGSETTYIVPEGSFNAIEVIGGSFSSCLNGVQIKGLTVLGSGLTGIGLYIKYLGLKSCFEDIVIQSCNGKGIYIEGSYDFQMRKIESRANTGLGIHVYEQNTFTASGLPYEEVSFITFDNVHAIANNSGGIQWLIEGADSLRLYNCKPSEGSIGLKLDKGCNRVKVDGLYCDGLADNTTVAIQVAHEWCHSNSFENISAWRCDTTIEFINGRNNYVGKLQVESSTAAGKGVTVRNGIAGEVLCQYSDLPITDESSTTAYTGNQCLTGMAYIGNKNDDGTYSKYPNAKFVTITKELIIPAWGGPAVLNVQLPKIFSEILFQHAHAEYTGPIQDNNGNWQDLICNSKIVDPSSINVELRLTSNLKTNANPITVTIKLLVLAA